MQSPTAKELSQRKYDPEWFRMIPSDAIMHKYFTDEPAYAASWDLFVTSKGRIFFPLCAEIYEASITRLYEYIPEEDRFVLHFKLEDVTIQHEDMIRASKIHTSIHELPDGRLIMTTHTTARSPLHPDWMPQAYFGHPWEGYRGSHILIYDLETGKVENRDIPVPEESIYGAKYDASHNCLYFTGYIRGHLYRYDLDTNRVRDYGKVTEYGSYRLAEGPDGHLYSASRTGNLFRINVQTQEIEELGIELPDNNGEASHHHRIISYSVAFGGKLYLQPTFSNGMWVYDPKENSLEYVGDFRPKIGNYEPDTDKSVYTQWIFGMALDEDDCLWYGYSHGGLHLIRWDFLHGGAPENMGIIGSPERGATIAAEILYQNGKLYIGDTNHLLDGPGVAVVDIKKLLAARKAGVQGELCKDGFAYLEVARGLDSEKFAFRPVPGFKPVPMDTFCEDLETKIQRYLDDEKSVARFSMKDNPFGIQSKTIKGALLWRQIGMELSPVQNIRWIDDKTLLAQTGQPNGEKREVILDTEGNVLRVRPIENFDRTPIPQRLNGLPYPYYPGRQYKAVPNAWTPWKDGSALVGTLDGMLAVVRKDSSVFSLGTACTNGPIHCLFSTDDHTIAYGVAGHDMDLGNVFRFDDQNGLRWLGSIYQEDLAKGMALASNCLSSVALSPDGKTLAVGGRDRMGCVYFMTF